MQLSRTVPRRLVGAGIALVLTAGLCATPRFASATPSPPPNPTDGQLNAARGSKEALAVRVGQLGASIADAQAQLQQLRGRQEFAEQKVAYTQSKWVQARDQVVVARQRVAAAKASVAAARMSVVGAHRKFVQNLQATYMGGVVDGTTGALLTAQDPGALLDRAAIEEYQAQYKLDAIGQLERATVVKSNKDAAAQRAERALVKAEGVAKRALADARQADADATEAVATAQQQQAALTADLTTERNELDAAQEQLATLNNQRGVYLAWRAEQARLAAIRAAKLAAERAARIKAAREAAARAAAARAAAARAAEVRAAEVRAAAAREAAREAAARARTHHGGGSAGGGSAGGSSSIPNPGSSAPASGGWTRAMARTAVNRAMSTLGTPYAWAGGNADGPTYGVCVSGDASNDCHVFGYDCSGLMMYAWGPYVRMDHYAATQYVQVGSYHPSAGELRPGDLVFWSYDGTRSGIHHVAMYIGGGRIIEAPYSGGYVQIASLYEYGSFFGATRPLT